MRTYDDISTHYSERTRKVHRVTVVVEFDDFSSAVIGCDGVKEASVVNNEHSANLPNGIPLVQDAPTYDLTIHVKGGRNSTTE